MGKIPCIETDGGFLAETNPILDYLEETHPQPALLPTDPFTRAADRAPFARERSSVEFHEVMFAAERVHLL
jgi:glutathione S-transferase